MAVLIIHTLIKQLGMHGARSRHREKTSESEKKTGRDSGRRISESKRPNDRKRVKKRERRGRGESVLHWVFQRAVIHGQ